MSTNAHFCHTLRPVQLQEFDLLNKEHIASVRRTLSERRLDPKYRFMPGKGFSSALTQAQAESLQCMSVILEKGWLDESQLNLLAAHIEMCRKRNEESKAIPFKAKLKPVPSVPMSEAAVAAAVPLGVPRSKAA